MTTGSVAIAYENFTTELGLAKQLIDEAGPVAISVSGGPRCGKSRFLREVVKTYRAKGPTAYVDLSANDMTPRVAIETLQLEFNMPLTRPETPRMDARMNNNRSQFTGTRIALSPDAAFHDLETARAALAQTVTFLRTHERFVVGLGGMEQCSEAVRAFLTQVFIGLFGCAGAAVLVEVGQPPDFGQFNDPREDAISLPPVDIAVLKDLCARNGIPITDADVAAIYDSTDGSIGMVRTALTHLCKSRRPPS